MAFQPFAMAKPQWRSRDGHSCAEAQTSMSMNEILTSRERSVLVLALNRTERLNAVNLTLYEALIRELEKAEADPEIRCVLVTGTGRAFCAGADLKAHREHEVTPEERHRYIAMAQHANRLMQTIGTPVVAAVNGHAIGAGLELALSADFAIVAEDAKLRLPEIVLGTFVGGGIVYTLSDRVGTLKARELIYLGDFFSGSDAAEIGVVNRAVPADRVMPEALFLARRLARRAPIPLAAAKRLIGPAAALSAQGGHGAGTNCTGGDIRHRRLARRTGRISSGTFTEVPRTIDDT